MYKKYSGYEVAIIKDGQIIKIYPQEQYNREIIEQYRGSPNYYGNSNQALPPEPTVIERHNEVPTVPTYSQVNTSSEIEQVFNAGIKPLINHYYQLAAVFALMIFAAVAYKLIFRKKPNMVLISIVGIFAMLYFFLKFINTMG